MASIKNLRITKVYAGRDNGSGTWSNGTHTSYSENGTAVYIRAWWVVEGDAAGTVTQSADAYKNDGSTPVTVGSTTTSKTASQAKLTGECGWLATTTGGFGLDDKHRFEFDITASWNSGSDYFEETATVYVYPQFRTMDVLAGGHGVAFGTKATKTGVIEVENFDVEIDGDVSTDNSYISIGSLAGRANVGDAQVYVSDAGALVAKLYGQDPLYDHYPIYMLYLSRAGNLAKQHYNYESGAWGDAQYYTTKDDINGMFAVETHTASTGSISAGGTKWVTVDCAKSGYTLLGPVGYYFNASASGASGSGTTVGYALRRSSATECQMALKNNGTAAANFTLEIQALYVKNS